MTRPRLPAHLLRGEGMQEVGYERFFETMVFPDSGERCEDTECPCGGIPKAANYTELDMDGYNTAEEALAGHAAMVEKWRHGKPGSS